MSFFPEDIANEELLTPEDILDEAVRDFARKMDEPKAMVHSRETSDRAVLVFVLRDSVTGSETMLFRVYRRKGLEYPASIEPPEDDLPDYLRRRPLLMMGAPVVTSPSPLAGYGSAESHVEAIPPSVIPGPLSGYGAVDPLENRWICSSPHEFRKKVQAVLCLDQVKVRMLSAIASARRSAKITPKVDAAAS